MQWRIYIVKFWTRAPPPWGSKFFQFHAVFGEIWQNRMLAPPTPRRVGAPSSGKSWIRHWYVCLITFLFIKTGKSSFFSLHTHIVRKNMCDPKSDRRGGKCQKSKNSIFLTKNTLPIPGVELLVENFRFELTMNTPLPQLEFLMEDFRCVETNCCILCEYHLVFRIYG